MLKKVLFAIVPVLLFTVALRADDSLGLDLAKIQDADVSIVDEGFDVDVDKLAADAGAESEDKAIEACFRSFGYRSYGYCGYSSYGCYNYGCYNYNYGCYRPYFYTYRPVYYSPVCYTPCYTSYWGCY
ncbi:hypothetical protein LOC68_02620 [Blastopirellula sp. JC732]|uniref:Uncharacterized protein n=1 Tax=Blastopirellula sediminis TaxID=2894196 RepID=A0A9X1MJY0_9BACT|nr:hypothetical protein [Blastopirellula sediminis]MCC9607930.1 hypothetical protein [Blastopirellula sediminis]MCC9627277.1 hypothetical protein [Blastopirellula sediminis]